MIGEAACATKNDTVMAMSAHFLVAEFPVHRKETSAREILDTGGAYGPLERSSMPPRAIRDF